MAKKGIFAPSSPYTHTQLGQYIHLSLEFIFFLKKKQLVLGLLFVAQMAKNDPPCRQSEPMEQLLILVRQGPSKHNVLPTLLSDQYYLLNAKLADLAHFLMKIHFIRYFFVKKISPFPRLLTYYACSSVAPAQRLQLFFEFRAPHPPLMQTRGTATTPQGFHFRFFDASGLVPP